MYFSSQQKNQGAYSNEDLHEAIHKLTKTICENYVNDWSTNLHNGKPDLRLELQDAIYKLLTALAYKLKHLDEQSLLLDFATLFRLHLSRLKDMNDKKKNFSLFNYHMSSSCFQVEMKGLGCFFQFL